MARLNSRLSTTASSRYASATPIPAISDQENRDPARRDIRKGKGRASGMPASGDLPTPRSADEHDTRAQKRRRVTSQGTAGSPNGNNEDDEEAKFKRYFDPNQDVDERRDIKRRIRALERGFNEKRDDILRNSDSRYLTETVEKANDIFNGIKQTNDATLDSRFLVNVSDLAYQKTKQLVLGDTSTGVDVDEFLSKCITYMRNGGPLENDDGAAPVRRQRESNRQDSDNESEDEGSEPLDWELLGRHACVPHNSRPAVPSFLLGPLSVQKKQRTQTQRRARQTHETGREARPENLTGEDLNLSNENDLKAVCGKLRRELDKHCERAEEALTQAGIQDADEFKTERGKALLRKNRITATGGPNLLEYALDPQDFGQTVENLFRISFLIKEGLCGVEPDEDGLPTICITKPRTIEEQRENNTSKHQAIFSLDYETWQNLVEAYGDRSPMIEHRETGQQTQVGARGWYN